MGELRQRAAREGHCFLHVQAITVAIDQYAEKAPGNRDYFFNQPYGVELERQIISLLVNIEQLRLA